MTQSGVRCPYCGGRGFTPEYHEDGEPTEGRLCGACDGSGIYFEPPRMEKGDGGDDA